MRLSLVLILTWVAQSSDEAVRLAKKTLASQLSASESSIALTRVEPVEWPDSSLGCPEPGRMYAQVITPGFRVTLSANDRSYRVHVGAGRAVVCEKTGVSLKERLAQKAREHLAHHLGVPAERIEVVSTTPKTWPDASLGCPEPDTMYAQVLTQGFVITLRASGKLHEYHSDEERVVACWKP